MAAIAVAVLGLGYLTCVGLLALNQRKLLFRPGLQRVVPDLPGITALALPTPDGETLVAWWHPPEPGQPVFLFFDGNGGRPEIQYDRWQKLIKRKAGFLAVYYRGYSGSTGHPTEAGLYVDGATGYDWLIAQGVLPDQIVIHGFSLGTGVASKLASERPARALILEAPYTNINDVVRHHFPFLPNELVWDRFNTLERIGKVTMPVLVVHGTRDHVVPFELGKAVFADANEPKTFVTMTDSDHATLVRDGLFLHIWPFLETLPARSSSSPARHQ